MEALIATKYQLQQLADADLLANTCRLVGRSNQVLAELLAHLAEVEARGIHRIRACSSLYTYCVYELRMSEDAAFRRARAARVARRFPIIFQQVADGELHLTAVVLLAPHLTEQNHRELLALAKHRTKREVLRLARAIAPAPTAPDRVEPLGPAPDPGPDRDSAGDSVGIPVTGSLPRHGTPTWREFVESFASGPRDLRPGCRPKDWVDSTTAEPEPETSDAVASASGQVRSESSGELELPDERYRIQFTASQEYADLLERAQDLLSHAVPDRSLEAVHLRALRLLVERLEKQKYGAPRPKSPPKPATSDSTADGDGDGDGDGDAAPAPVPAPGPAGAATAPDLSESKKRTHVTRQRGAHGADRPNPSPKFATSDSKAKVDAEADADGDTKADAAPAPTAPKTPDLSESKKRTHVTRQRGAERQRGTERQRGAAAVRREVRDRDGLRCAFVDDEGRRCTETRYLELHHLHAHARGGGETTGNLVIYCQAHNALAAERDFGREFILTRRAQRARPR